MNKSATVSLQGRTLFLMSFLLFLAGSAQSFGSTMPPCPGTMNVCRFRLLVVPTDGGAPLPVQNINVLEAGQKIKFEPVHIPPVIRDSAKVALIVVAVPTSEEAKIKPAEGQDEQTETPALIKEEMKEAKQDIHVLEPLPAKDVQEWEIPVRASVVGLVFGPHGLDARKVNSLVVKNPDLIPQLTDYAEQTTKVGALVEALQEYQQRSDPSLDLNAALAGFGSDYDVFIPKINTVQPASLQAAVLMQAVVPSFQSLDPATSNTVGLIAQSAGLAGVVASMFFGTPVGVAAGGAELLLNLRTMVFPDTDFRSAFTQPFEATGLALCAKSEPDKPHMRSAYLWMMKVPDALPPTVALEGPAYVPIGGKALITVPAARPAESRLLLRARRWELVAAKQHADLPVSVHVAPHGNTLDLDLSQVRLPPGQYQLAAMWDWQHLTVKGDVDLRPMGDFVKAKVAQESADHLVEGTGLIKTEVVGTDFEFVEKVAMVNAGDKKATPKEITFALPKGTAQGDQETMELDVDTSAWPAGSYHLILTQTNGSTHDVPLIIHPPNPTLENLPLRVNVGESEQIVVLRGKDLERITHIATPSALWDLSAVKAEPHELLERKATVKLLATAHIGELMSANVFVQDIEAPIVLPGTLEVAGPRPKIGGVSMSLAQQPDIHLGDGEIPAGTAVSFSLLTRNVDAHPALSLTCANEGFVRQQLLLHPGDRIASAQLDFAGEDGLFLSVDPGVVGQSGCQLAATLTTNTGSSDPTVLGRLIRLPRIEKFALSEEKLGPNLYAGSLAGVDLQIIEKTGWDSKTGFPAQGIPTPVPGGGPEEQTLKVELPWPPPSPHAPIYVWLRGETTGRLTDVKY